jgi:hypothetical protein
MNRTHPSPETGLTLAKLFDHGSFVLGTTRKDAEINTEQSETKVSEIESQMHLLLNRSWIVLGFFREPAGVQRLYHEILDIRHLHSQSRVREDRQ